MIKARLRSVQDNIERVCHAIGRDPAEIVLVGATKYSSVSEIREAVEAGLKDIGESKVQDAREKFAELKDILPQVTKHMIGHLQTNKVKSALELFDVIQSVDSAKLIGEIEKQAAWINRTGVDIFIEVNVSGEAQKFGVAKENIFRLAEEIILCPRVRLLGLMTMAPLTEDKNIIRQSFRLLRNLSEEISEHFIAENKVEMRYLSMGMSHDYEIALEEGANMLRIGSAIFG